MMTSRRDSLSSAGLEPALATAASEPEAAVFIMRLARALHAYGTPAHRLEQTLETIGRRLDIDGQYLVTPTSIVASIGRDDRRQAFLERVSPGGIDLGKLCDLHRLIKGLGEGRFDVAAARSELTSIVERPPRQGRSVTVASFGLVSAAAAVFFDGGLHEVLAAAAIGLAIGLLSLAASSSARLALVSPALSGAVAGLGAGAVAGVLDPLFPFIPTLAGLIILIPGLSLTVAVNEVAHGHLVSGTARLTGALMTLLQIAFGVALGSRVARELFGPAFVSPPEPLPAWAPGLAVAATAIGLVVLFRARVRDLPMLLAAVATAFTASRLGTTFLGPELGVLLGAFLVGTLGYLLARLREVPSAVAILPGILPLVPGGLGFRSLQALMADDVLAGVQSAFTMAIMALSLVTGLLLAGFARRSDQSL